MTLTEGGRRVAARPAFPSERNPLMSVDGDGRTVMLTDPGMTIHEHATLEYSKSALAGALAAPGVSMDSTDSEQVDLLMGSAERLADAYCNALAEREAGR